MALQGFDEVYYLGVKLAALQAETPAVWTPSTTIGILKDYLANAGYTPESHYQQYGWKEGLAPNEFFDPTDYATAKATLMFEGGGYASVAAALGDFYAKWPQDPYQHYLLYGDSENVNPSNDFDVSEYYQAKLEQLQATDPSWTDVSQVKAAFAAAGLTALGHFLAYGQAEGLEAIAVTGDERVNVPETPAGMTFTPVHLMADGADVLRITGDQDVRIDFTNPANQVTGLDLNGNGIIEPNGIENAITGVAANYEIVDAYARNPLNEYDIVNNFLGDIRFDGTGFDGDGVSTDGNIFLGGLGADTAFGGIGNDFLAGGNVGINAGGTRDTLLGGRNADFFFAELSNLTDVDGDVLVVDGGKTADDTAAAVGQSAQDADWLLLEASDDDEPVTITLNEGNELKDAIGSNVTTASGQSMTTYDVENLNASGYLYGFLDNMNVEIGGRSIDSRDVAITTPVGDYGDTNYGLGTSAQMAVTGSSAANIIITGYDNDSISGGAGDDLLFGGDLRFIKTHNNNPNLLNITNDGMDRIAGGDGDDSLVWEVDGGSYAGDSGVDTLFITDYSIGRTAATEQLTADAQLDATGTGYDSQVLRIDLGYAAYRGYRGDTLGEGTDHSDEENDTSDSNHRAGTADQTNYDGGAFTTVTGMENVIASGMGDIDYSADGTNDSDAPGFVQQQNYRGSALNMELRGTDGVTVNFTTTVEIELDQDDQFDVNDLSEAEIDQLYLDYLSVGNGAYDWAVEEDDADNDFFLTREEFEDLLFDQGFGYTVTSRTENVTQFSVADGANILYAGTGNDILEGRKGNDSLMGNEGNDDFVFQLNGGNETLRETVSNDFSEIVAAGSNVGDGVDVIHRQVQTAIGNNLTDGTFSQDFGLDETQETGVSLLRIDIVKAGGNAPGDELSDVVNFVSQITTGVEVDGTFESIVLDTPEILAATTYQGLVDAINAALDATEFGVDLQATLQTDGHTIFITDEQGRELADSISEVPGAGVYVNQKANTATANIFEYGQPAVEIAQDRLIYKAYEDRFMNEGVDDDAILGSTISLGRDAYAEDLVVDFAADGTRIAEDQRYTIQFTDLKPEDVVSVEINGVIYSLQVAKALDGTLIAGETNNAFVARLATYINQFMDDDTAAGAVDAVASTNLLILNQRSYNGEETVFMDEPEVTLTNLSGGQLPVKLVTNVSQHEVHLLDFDGQDANLNRDNVLFVGEEFINRSILETADDQLGGRMDGSSSMVIDSVTDDLVNSDLTDITVNLASTFDENFSVHGDDYLIGGDADDQIYGLSGDDRIIGSLATDTVDGGKNWYAIQVLGEEQARVEYLNGWEAANFTITGEVISSRDLIAQSEDGINLVDGYFDDTLVFEQADFVAGVTDFTIILDGFTPVTPTATVREVEFRNDGAGSVETDVNGDNVIGDNVTTFTNFENIRTVSGINQAVAHRGQGNDTLDISALSTATFGVEYHLTNTGLAGDVWYARNDLITTAGDFGLTGDYLERVMKVDGVENVISGLGDDLLNIDETEAAKDNLFSADLGVDTITYLNEYNDFFDGASEPRVTIRVNDAVNTDTVTMTRGALGLVEATDTLVSVEHIVLGGNTAEGLLEDDVIDVTAMTDGAVVDYTNGQIRDLNGNIQVVIHDIVEMENVWADGDDTVIVADADVMNNNQRSYENDDSNPSLGGIQVDITDIEKIAFATYLDYDDDFYVDGSRVAFEDLAPSDITDVVNQFQFTFDMSRGGAIDDDIIDYSAEGGRIISAVDFTNDTPDHYVVIDGDRDVNPVSLIDAESRVDHLIDVEGIVAAGGAGSESVIDLTAFGENVNLRYQKIDTGSAVSTNIADADTVAVDIFMENQDTSAPYEGFRYIEYYDNADADAVIGESAYWTRVEGSDSNEYIELTADQLDIVHTFNLRGGANEVNYNEQQSRGIRLSVQDLDTVAGITTLNIQGKFNDGTLVNAGDNGAGGGIAGNGVIDGSEAWTAYDRISSYNNLSDIPGTLRIEASQSEDDDIDFTSLATSQLLILGQVEGSDDIVTVSFETGLVDIGLTLTGFETLIDSGMDDTYVIEDLTNFMNTLALVDSAAFDEDTLVLTDGALETFGGIVWNADVLNLDQIENEIDVENGTLGGPFDFRVFDISNLEDDTDVVSTTGIDETVILGDIGLIGDIDATDDIQGFTKIVFTTTDGMGTDIVIDTDLGELRDADGTLLMTFDSANVFDFSAIDDDMNVTVVDTNAIGVTVITDGADEITGDEGDDFLVGGADADVLDGGVIPEVLGTLTFTFSSGVMGLGASSITFTSGAEALVLQSDGTVDGVGAVDFITTGGLGANATGADIATVLGSLSVSQLNTHLNANIVGVSYETAAGAGSVTFTFNAGTGTPAAALITAGIVTAGADTILVNGADASPGPVNSSVGPAYAGEDNSADIYAYYNADESTLAGMDTLVNFDSTDSIWLDSSIISLISVLDKGDALNFANLGTPTGFFGGSNIAVGTNGQDGMIFIDVNDDNNLDANDMRIMVDGVTNANDFDDASDFFLATLGTPFADTIFGVDGDVDGDGVDDGAIDVPVADVIVSFASYDNIDITETAAVPAVDTIIFAASADVNGIDTITGFTAGNGGDVLNFTSFLGGVVAFQAGPFTIASAGDVDIDNDVAIFDNNGTELTATTLAAEFNGAGNSFAVAANDVAVVIEINNAITTEDAKVWYVSDLNGNGAIAADEVSLVGVLNNAGEGLVSANFAI